MKSKIVGSAVSVLLFFSAISYSRTFIQPQDPKPVPQTTRQIETSNPQSDSQTTSTNTSSESKLPDRGLAESSTNTSSLRAATEKAAVSSGNGPSPSSEVIAVPAQAYMATAYSLRGRTSRRNKFDERLRLISLQ